MNLPVNCSPSRLTKRRSPTTTGNIERFHRTLCRELLDETGAFETIEAAQIAIDEWVHAYNTVRPHHHWTSPPQPPCSARDRRAANPMLQNSMSPTPAATCNRLKLIAGDRARYCNARLPQWSSTPSSHHQVLSISLAPRNKFGSGRTTADARS